MIIVGNKTDLESKRDISLDEVTVISFNFNHLLENFKKEWN